MRGVIVRRGHGKDGLRSVRCIDMKSNEHTRRAGNGGGEGEGASVAGTSSSSARSIVSFVPDWFTCILGTSMDACDDARSACAPNAVVSECFSMFRLSQP